MRASPAASDAAPMGTGPDNRHGMPKLPVGQSVTEKWPVLDLGIVPRIDLDRWRLEVDGAVENPLTLTWPEFLALPQVEDVSDFHCVTGWSRLDMRWQGVAFETLAALVRPTMAASHVMFHAYDGYSTNLPLEEALKPDVLLVHSVEGAPLTVEHGGPVRIVVPIGIQVVLRWGLDVDCGQPPVANGGPGDGRRDQWVCDRLGRGPIWREHASAEPGVLRMAVLKTDRVLFSQRYISAGGNIVAARRRENRRQKRLRLKRYWIQDYGIHDIVFVELVA